LTVHAEDSECEVAECSPVGLLPHRGEGVETTPRLDFDVDARHPRDVTAHPAGPDWFGIRPAVKGEPVGDDALRRVPSMLP
jgi:hypothetical protein